MDSEIEQEILALTTVIKLNPNDADALYRRGALYWKLERRVEAMNDYAASAHIDPNGRGATAARAAKEILNFYNTDLYNP